MRLVSLAACAALASAPAFAADFSGTWNITSKVGDNPVSIVCTLAQKGDALTGTCKPAQFDASETKGTVSGSSAKWGYDVVFNGTENHVEYEATLGADGRLAGTLHLGPMPTPFTAVRQ
ncbi:MAG TPA: hypothetical protein VFJ95_18005 [Gammaproteobacteria bacterium]|jgi:opacity protein-like surface antigen|nr:hypothetical protein [Gammaproteobacteria bacterium]